MRTCTVEVIMPLTIGAAIGFMTSEPMPDAQRMGTNSDCVQTLPYYHQWWHIKVGSIAQFAGEAGCGSVGKHNGPCVSWVIVLPDYAARNRNFVNDVVQLDADRAVFCL